MNARARIARVEQPTTHSFAHIECIRKENDLNQSEHLNAHRDITRIHLETFR